MIIDGEYVGDKVLETAFDCNINERTLGPAARPVFGVDESQENAYIFTATSNWMIEEKKVFLQNKEIYNAVFFDGGRSTGMNINDEDIISGRDIVSVLKVVEEK